jgi:hypothetical protein
MADFAVHSFSSFFREGSGGAVGGWRRNEVENIATVMQSNMAV